MAQARAAEREPAGVSESPLSVSQLAARIDATLQSGFLDPVWFVGEVSGFRERTHWYFDLKDAGAVVNCVMFQSVARRMGSVPQNGLQLLARGRVEFYAPGGKVSLILDRLQPVGAGSLELAYRAMCDELRGLGWFAPERKRPIPTFPRRVAVITSRTGAALQDVLVTMQRRCPAVGVLLVDCRVQGASAAPEIAAAISYLSKHAGFLGLDALLVTRGGGSMEDLWAFNDREVASAIVSCSVPVVAAIGHETDTTIAELVADERCATPTQAAMRLTPDATALARQVDSTAARLTLLISRLMSAEQRRLLSLSRRPVFTLPARAFDGPRNLIRSGEDHLRAVQRRALLLANSRLQQVAFRLERHRPAAVHARLLARLSAAAASLLAAGRTLVDRTDIDVLSARINRAAASQLCRSRDRIEARERELSAISPLRVLQRGYSVTSTLQGSLVRTPSDAPPGTTLRTRLADGEVQSTVRKSPDAPPLSVGKPSRSKPSRPPRQSGLDVDKPGLWSET
ncbi:MAG: exodeoxyribonuclease VII large subunit [Phycisphaerae bacterium]|nr:exodeoxyribonuclease VII large subunit [Phycisphaerae bacterium]